MKRCRFSALAAGLILSGSLCLSGCSVGLKDAYSLKERVPSIEASFAAEDEAAKGFASDLCVISDEGSFDPEDVTSQAGALFDLTDREVLYSKDAFEKMLQVFGIVFEEEVLDEDIEKLIEERQAARANKDFATADRIRDELAAQGIKLLDTKEGVRPRLVSLKKCWSKSF